MTEMTLVEEADEEREAAKLRDWLILHGDFEAYTLKGLRLRVLRTLVKERLARAGAVDPQTDQRHAAAVACCAADRIEAPPPPDQMIAAIQNRHLGAWRWAGIIFGPQTASATDWQELYQRDVEDLRDDYVAMQKRALAEKKRANEAEAKLVEVQADRAFLLSLAMLTLGVDAIPGVPEVAKRAAEVLRAQSPVLPEGGTVNDYVRATLERVAGEAQPTGVVPNG